MLKRLIVPLVSFTSISIVLLAYISADVLADRPLPTVDEKVTYSNKGSKSEAAHWYLLVDKKAIPDTFSLVWQEGRLYRFHQRQHLWGIDGYAPVKDDSFIIPASNKTITQDDITRKWYLGKARMKDTPGHWAYVEWQNSAAFVDPVAINTLAEKLKLIEIPRSVSADYLKE